MRECQRHVSSAEMAEWQAFDRFEPFGARNVPDLLALLVTVTANPWRQKGQRPWLPQDVFPDPLQPSRLTVAQEGARTAQVIGDYRRLRAERLAKMAATQGE